MLLFYKNHTTGFKCPQNTFFIPPVSCRDLTCVFCMTLGAGHTTVEYQKYMSLDGEISLTEYTGFLQDTAHSELVLKSTNENVQ